MVDDEIEGVAVLGLNRNELFVSGFSIVYESEITVRRERL
ncbi:hypothetical protein SDC9_198482 [bioreactor metagenome]|uniref:Uncharacterized protein n=1 Tax=bioreactor metagenome TaxID=1076179 RepID=A0A645IUL5_9ZZZZ